MGKDKKSNGTPSSSTPAPRARHPNKNIVRSGNTHPTPPASKNELLFPPGYKTPLSLLAERCQKRGWDRPAVDARKAAPPLDDGDAAQSWTAVVHLRRTVKSKQGGLSVDSVRLEPPPPRDSADDDSRAGLGVRKPTALEARHFAAVYALHRFENALGLHLQLPPGAREYWRALEDDRKTRKGTPAACDWLYEPDPFEASKRHKDKLQHARATAASSSLAATAATTTTSSSTVPFGSSASSSSTPTETARGATATIWPKRWREAPDLRMAPDLRDKVERCIRSAAASSLNDDYDDSSTVDDQHTPLSTLLRFLAARTTRASTPSSSSSSSVAHSPQRRRAQGDSDATVQLATTLRERLVQRAGFRDGHVSRSFDWLADVAQRKTIDVLGLLPLLEHALDAFVASPSSSSDNSSSQSQQLVRALEHAATETLVLLIVPEDDLPRAIANENRLADARARIVRHTTASANSSTTTGRALMNDDSGLLERPPGSATHVMTTSDDAAASSGAVVAPAGAQREGRQGVASRSLARAWQAERLARDSGVPLQHVESALARADRHEGRAVDLLLRKLAVASATALGAAAAAAAAPDGDAEKDEDEVDSDDELEARRNDELEALMGVYGEHVVTYDPATRTIEIALHTAAAAATASTTTTIEPLVLRVLLHDRSRYPSPGALPTFYLVSQAIPPYIRVHLMSELARVLSGGQASRRGGQSLQARADDWRELVDAGQGGVVGEMVSLLLLGDDDGEGLAQHALRDPPHSRDVFALLDGAAAPAAQQLSRPSTPPVTSTGTRAPRRRPQPSAAQDDALKAHLARLRADSAAYRDMLAARARLPAHEMRDAVCDLIESHRVVVLSGETGSGKTTQVPSFVLERMMADGRGSHANIVVTQPRRVSALGVASRVAHEWAEDVDALGPSSLVGYAIRGQRRASKGCRLLFCTTGVVLARLSRGQDSELADISHIFVDEVHERSVESDFLLLELRDLLKRNKRIKVILMSATINQRVFSDYFGRDAALFEIPGRTHPVQDHYLEDILPRLSYQPAGRPAKKMAAAELESMHAAFRAKGVTDEATLRALETLTRSERIDYGLTGAVCAYCLRSSADQGGAVLVFMSGVAEIRQAIEAIKSAVAGMPVDVLPLHANLSTDEQKAVFKPPRAGHRKVVVSTNVAETSVTIDDIVYVVDAARVKENRYDPGTGLVRLVEGYTSKAASKQRRGRAGRVRPGQCYKLYTTWTESRYMADQPTPELVRIPLEMLSLQIKAIHEDADVRAYLSRAITPPDMRAVDRAWALLIELGAIDPSSGRLTALGRHLSMMPIDLRIGKMLIYGAIFCCLDPILDVAAILANKPLFLSPPDQKSEATAAHMRFLTDSSDLLSVRRAFCELYELRRSQRDLRALSEEAFISLSAFREIVAQRRELLDALVDVGFVAPGTTFNDRELNANADNVNLLKTLVFAGTGHVVKIKMPASTFDKGISGAIERDRESREIKFYDREERLFLHPSSLLFSQNRYATTLMTYFRKNVTSKPFLMDATQIPHYAALLFGGSHVRSHPGRGLSVSYGRGDEDEWLVFKAWPRIGVLVNALRRLLDAELAARVDEPARPAASETTSAILALLERDGESHRG